MYPLFDRELKIDPPVYNDLITYAPITENQNIVNTAGRWITPCKWDDIDKFGETLLGSHWGFVHLLSKEEIPPQWYEPQEKRRPWEKLPYETANYFYSESPLGHGGGSETMVLFRADELSRSAVKVQIGEAELWMPDQTLL